MRSLLVTVLPLVVLADNHGGGGQECLSGVLRMEVPSGITVAQFQSTACKGVVKGLSAGDISADDIDVECEAREAPAEDTTANDLAALCTARQQAEQTEVDEAAGDGAEPSPSPSPPVDPSPSPSPPVDPSPSPSPPVDPSPSPSPPVDPSPSPSPPVEASSSPSPPVDPTPSPPVDPTPSPPPTPPVSPSPTPPVSPSPTPPAESPTPPPSPTPASPSPSPLVANATNSSNSSASGNSSRLLLDGGDGGDFADIEQSSRPSRRLQTTSMELQYTVVASESVMTSVESVVATEGENGAPPAWLTAGLRAAEEEDQIEIGDETAVTSTAQTTATAHIITDPSSGGGTTENSESAACMISPLLGLSIAVVSNIV